MAISNDVWAEDGQWGGKVMKWPDQEQGILKFPSEQGCRNLLVVGNVIVCSALRF